ncbi:MAG: Rnase Y domain-containing protein, partial [Muribaculaceae bacterium]|nr:Rnase Y domain-containing protein [Muribaculaceae bacterium]
MTTAIWIIIAVVAAAAGYAAASSMSKKNANSRANMILEEARKDAEVIKDKKIIEAKEQEVKILADAERNANSKLQKAQASEARAKQREMQLNQQQNELNRRKKELDSQKQSLDTRINNAENLERT